MSKSRSHAGTVDFEGVTYDWHLQREPHLSDDEGWKGMTISLLQRDAKREALLEFPPSKRLLKGLPPGRLQLDDGTISRCEVGWTGADVARQAGRVHGRLRGELRRSAWMLTATNSGAVTLKSKP